MSEMLDPSFYGEPTGEGQDANEPATEAHEAATDSAPDTGGVQDDAVGEASGTVADGDEVSHETVSPEAALRRSRAKSRGIVALVAVAATFALPNLANMTLGNEPAVNFNAAGAEGDTAETSATAELGERLVGELEAATDWARNHGGFTHWVPASDIRYATGATTVVVSDTTTDGVCVIAGVIEGNVDVRVDDTGAGCTDSEVTAVQAHLDSIGEHHIDTVATAKLDTVVAAALHWAAGNSGRLDGFEASGIDATVVVDRPDQATVVVAGSVACVTATIDSYGNVLSAHNVGC